MELEEMLLDWENRNYTSVINYILGQCRRSQLVAFAAKLAMQPNGNAKVMRLMIMLDAKES